MKLAFNDSRSPFFTLEFFPPKTDQVHSVHCFKSKPMSYVFLFAS